MNEQDWNECADPQVIMDWLNRGYEFQEVSSGHMGYPVAQPTDRQLRLFAVACCRQVWSQFTDERSRRAVEVAEIYADNPVLTNEMIELRRTTITGCLQFPAGSGARHVVIRNKQIYGQAGYIQAAIIRCIWNPFAPPLGEEEKVKCKRCVAGAIYHPGEIGGCVFCKGFGYTTHCIKPRWLTPDVKQMAEAVYQSREMVECGECDGRGWNPEWDINKVDCSSCHGEGSILTGCLDPFGVLQLADMLEDCGCPVEVVEKCGECDKDGWLRDVTGLGIRCPHCHGEKTIRRPHPWIVHLRSETKHWKGCWAVDAARGEE